MGGRSWDNPLHGLCQGNGAAPACWLMISSLLMHCYHRKGWGSSIISPMSRTLISFLGQIYVDDTDLIIMQPNYMCAEDLWEDLQSSVTGWGNLLLATGGALNPSKCSWYLTDYTCVNGIWVEAEPVQWELLIPLPGNKSAPIPCLPNTQASKMLGVWSCPAGSDEKHLSENITARYKTWLSRSCNGHLPSRLNWISYCFSLWPGICYGISTLAMPTSTLTNKLRKLDFDSLSLLGVNKHVKVQWSTLAREFGGVGLYCLEVEQTVGWMNMILQHYGVPTTLGLKCMASLECLQLEIGAIGCPLAEPYNILGPLCTHSWWKAVWERTQRYNIQLLLDYPTLRLPREHDCTLTNLFISENVSKSERIQLNRCRIALRAIFLSDITSACGRRLEHWVLTHDVALGRTSTFTFPREYPTPDDWNVWTEFWKGWICKDSTLPVPLGNWIAPTHQRWQ